jgi:hypothetical protein
MDILVAERVMTKNHAKKPPQFVAEAACGQSPKQING